MKVRNLILTIALLAIFFPINSFASPLGKSCNIDADCVPSEGDMYYHIGYICGFVFDSPRNIGTEIRRACLVDLPKPEDCTSDDQCGPGFQCIIDSRDNSGFRCWFHDYGERGALCRDNNDCNDDLKCTDAICEDLSGKENAWCKTNADCNANNRCKWDARREPSGKCEKRFDKGHDCVIDRDCKSNLVCFSRNHKCTERAESGGQCTRDRECVYGLKCFITDDVTVCRDISENAIEDALSGKRNTGTIKYDWKGYVSISYSNVDCDKLSNVKAEFQISSRPVADAELEVEGDVAKFVTKEQYPDLYEGEEVKLYVGNSQETRIFSDYANVPKKEDVPLEDNSDQNVSFNFTISGPRLKFTSPFDDDDADYDDGSSMDYAEAFDQMSDGASSEGNRNELSYDFEGDELNDVDGSGGCNVSGEFNPSMIILISLVSLAFYKKRK